MESVSVPFGRIGNLINGDIIGYPSALPWSTVYDNAASWALVSSRRSGPRFSFS